MLIDIINWFVNLYHGIFTGQGCYCLRKFHIYCPGCGGTRALHALLHLDILQSLKYNPFIIILIIYFTLLFMSVVFKVKLVNNKTANRIIASWMIYAAVRDILLVFFNVDLLMQ